MAPWPAPARLLALALPGLGHLAHVSSHQAMSAPGHWTLAPPEESGEWSPVTSGAETRQEQRDTQEPCDVSVTR